MKAIPTKSKRKILILGAGFGGLYTLRYLQRHLKKGDNPDITLINEHSYFLFSPVLHEAATGVVEISHIISPIWQPGCGFKFIKSEVTRIDLDERQVVTTTGTIDYDLLVIALGSVALMPDVPRVHQNIFPMKTLKDISEFKNQLAKMFEEANAENNPERVKQLLTFVISGGGYAGVQLAATLRDVTHGHLAKYYDSISREDIRIILVETRERIMHHLRSSPNHYIERHLTSAGVQVMVNSQITRVADGSVEINGKDIIATNTVVWTAGVQTNPRVAEMNVKKDDLGRIYVDEYLQLPGYPGVYAVGDCIHFQAPKSKETATPRAHNAVRQARVVANNIAAELKGKERRHYHFTDSAEVISLGRSKALLRLGKQWIYGLPAIAMFVISYSALAVGKRNRLATIVDWLLSRFFGPYITPID
jgi:NADH dehydrogenase